MNFNFGEILTRAWQIVWKRRVLWIFGILAGCSRGGSSFNWNLNDSGGGFDGGAPNFPPEVMQFFNFLAENIVAILSISAALICILWILAIFLGTIGRIGLIRGTWLADTEGFLSVGSLFSESLPYFWRVFGLALLVGLPFFFVIAALVAGSIAFGIGLSQGNNASALGFLAFIPFLVGCICLLIPIGLVIGLIVRQSERAIVLENAGLLDALSRGWNIFISNLGPLIVMAIILWVISLVVGFVIAIPVLIVVVPATFAFLAGEGQNWNVMMLALACTCLLAPFLWLVNGVLTAYIESAWTLTYMRIARPQDTPPAIVEANA